MFENVIVLAPDDVVDQISQQLRFLNPSLQIMPAASRAALRALSPAVLAKARLIAFTSPIVVPADVLAAVGYGAYNFHPAPPSYPGLAPALFAIYHGARTYGATAHVMVEKVDSGSIVGAELCTVAEDASVFDIEMQSFTLLAKIFTRLAPHLATNPAPLPILPITWSGDKSSRRSLTEICDIALDIERSELDRRVRAFANNHFGVQPTITLHGHRFRLISEPVLPKAQGAPDGVVAAAITHNDIADASPQNPAQIPASAAAVRL